MPHVSVDLDVCEDHAQCVFAAPTVFRMNDDDRLEYDAEYDEDLRFDVQAAADSCPVQAIKLLD
ncbi:ferredoxin [Pseudofrankia asymbiotica]|uniref:Ferredoxin n=1 Tax=Pseudofrankia asymbiotica TaxID=1834516 RepID=A0A1V2I7V0_9ACTN|nr:ferredoxin [Pseudofrankia asymbiotica]ONH28029.1 ferredoxin [Pseudofrankia asymbiotica]